uniref:Uncharacterized protein LOC101503853 n=1 Tax=Cicer arietinum TaxID=3827 RepID=A0A3Q7Y7Q4_CICAR|nr:uncharacterized protein LOC101503853 [Cicer arietinum]
MESISRRRCLYRVYRCITKLDPKHQHCPILKLICHGSSIFKECGKISCKATKGKITDIVSEELKDDMEMSANNCEHSAVFSSLPMVIKWLRDRAQQNQSVRFQVLVTGSLHLVGNVLKLVKK